MNRQRVFSLALGFAWTAAACAASAADGVSAADGLPHNSVAAIQPAEPSVAASAALAALSADQIVEKNVTARGGLEAWRKIQTIVWTGHIETGSPTAPILPFALEMKRPNKTHFEVNAQGDKSARIFDGTHGWKIRPGRGGKLDTQPFTLEELKFAHDAPAIDGRLIDHEAKGIKVDVDGVEELDGHQAYRLNITLPSGAKERLWVDAHSFLEVKSEHQIRASAGLTAWVPMFYRNYQTVEGVQIPFTVETGASAGKAADKLVIQQVLVNPPLDDQVFAKPELAKPRGWGSGQTASARPPRPAHGPPVVSDLNPPPPAAAPQSESDAGK
jgi:hypothetical protein